MALIPTALLFLGMLQPLTDMESTLSQRQDTFDRIVEETMAEADAPGVFVAILHNGKTIYQRETGVADIQTRTPMTATSPGRLASATKVLSSLAILSMAEDGGINLDDRICDVVPDMPSKWCNIPLWRLMNHTSGIPLILAQDAFHEIPDMDKLDLSSNELMDFVSNRELDFEPGRGWHYQQSGLVILAHLLEQVSGKSWKALLKGHVLTAAQMTQTRWTRPMANQAPAYDRQEERLATSPAFYPKHMSQGGGYDTTGNDLKRLLAAVADKTIVSHAFWEQQLLRQDRLHQLGRDTDQEGYGLASIVQVFGEATTYGHSGGGGLAEIRYSFAPNIGVAVLTNRAGGTGAANKIASRLLEEILGPQARTPLAGK